MAESGAAVRFSTPARIRSRGSGPCVMRWERWEWVRAKVRSGCAAGGQVISGIGGAHARDYLANRFGLQLRLILVDVVAALRGDREARVRDQGGLRLISRKQVPLQAVSGDDKRGRGDPGGPDAECRAAKAVNIGGLLIAMGQNLKRLLAATRWGRRHAPSGSLMALPSHL